MYRVFFKYGMKAFLWLVWELDLKEFPHRQYFDYYCDYKIL